MQFISIGAFLPKIFNKFLFLLFVPIFTAVNCIAQQINQPLSLEERSIGFGNLIDSYIKGRRGYSNKVFDFLERYVDLNKTILDLGCGTGLATNSLATRFHEVHGCDIDEKMLAIARQTTSDKILYKNGSAYQLPYQNDQFGAITMFTSFHWFCNTDAVHEICRVLEPDAFVYIVDCSGVPFGDQLKAILETNLGHKLIHSKQGFAPEKVLTENGFNFIAKQDFKVVLTFTVEDAIERIRSMSIWNDVIRSGKEQKFIEYLRTFYSKKTNPNDGLIHYETQENVLLFQKTKSLGAGRLEPPKTEAEGFTVRRNPILNNALQ